jgi:xanthine dehydrogenase YagT iron-sulfur-binding subunit
VHAAACTVLVNGERINSCLALAAQYEGCEITTIEALSAESSLSALQAAFIAHDGLQCGYCISGQICSATAMAKEFQRGLPSAVTSREATSTLAFSDEEIRERMSGNICRCGAYNRIVDAIHATFDIEMAP